MQSLLLPHMGSICVVFAQAAAHPKPSVYSSCHTRQCHKWPHPADSSPGTHKPLEPSSTTAPLEEGMLPQELLLLAGLQPRLTQHCQWPLAALRGCAKVLWPQCSFVCLISCVSNTSPEYKGTFHRGAEGRFNSSGSSWHRHGETLSIPLALGSLTSPTPPSPACPFAADYKRWEQIPALPPPAGKRKSNFQ